MVASDRSPLLGRATEHDSNQIGKPGGFADLCCRSGPGVPPNQLTAHGVVDYSCPHLTPPGGLAARQPSRLAASGERKTPMST